jgi:hypothetical protein
MVPLFSTLSALFFFYLLPCIRWRGGRNLSTCSTYLCLSSPGCYSCSGQPSRISFAPFSGHFLWNSESVFLSDLLQIRREAAVSRERLSQVEVHISVFSSHPPLDLWYELACPLTLVSPDPSSLPLCFDFFPGFGSGQPSGLAFPEANSLGHQQVDGQCAGYYLCGISGDGSVRRYRSGFVAGSPSLSSF